jgi:hypothetical protein
MVGHRGRRSARRASPNSETENGGPGSAFGEGSARQNGTTLREGETLSVHVVEEELVVQKVPRVTQEAVIRKEREAEPLVPPGAPGESIGPTRERVNKPQCYRHSSL